ncbi:MAG: MFS transporter [Brooklawnia sp.]|uniref:MFS transporter n=1 Tax=Brooklawnia sp. TaxID=2699740 RepID=UPI003C71CFF1
MHDAPVRRRSVAAGAVGNLVEWFDWSVYGFFAPYFAASFFPQSDRIAQLLSVFAVFAVGFFVRPLGGAVLGSYADRHGRRAGMTLTILMMAGASALMALTPAFATIGIAAPILLVIGRSLQGFSAGGEFGTSSVFLVENAEPGRRASVGMWQQVSVGAGTLSASLLASVMFAVLSPEALSSWGWRLAFLIGAGLGLVGLYLRARVPDTAVSTHVRATGQVPRRPLVAVFRSHPRQAFLVIALVAAGTGLVQFWFVYLPTLAQLRTGAELRTGQVAAAIGLAVFTVLLPLFGWLSDRFGRRPMLIFFALGSAVSFVPLVLGLRPSLLNLALTASLAGVLLSSYAASLAAVMAEQFPPEVRTAGISLPYGVAVAIFGGLSPLVATALQDAGRFGFFLAGVVVLCLASAVVYWRMPETRDLPL